MSMRIKTYIALLLFVSHFCASSRTIAPCLNVPDSEKLDPQLIQEKIEDSAYFKKVKEELTVRNIAFHSCRNDRGLIDIADEMIKFKGKNCALSDFDIPFLVRKGNIHFKGIGIGSQYHSILDYKKNFLPRAMSEAFTSSEIENFFSQVKNCQVKLEREGKKTVLFFNLKNGQNEFCFFRTNLLGKEISIIKRLYAKNSRCE